MKYAIQFKESGQLIDYCETREQAQNLLNSYPVELIEISKASKVVVTYTELGGPWGYGHQEDSFTTYGGLRHCIVNLYKWMQSTARTFGPDARDIKDFLRKCNLYINGIDKSSWLRSQVDKIDIKAVYA